MSAEVDAYIAAAPKAAQPLLRQLRAAIKAEAPNATERLSYGMPYYDLDGRLVYFALHAKHIGLYPVGHADRATELEKYLTGKGTLQLPLDQPLPIAAIRRLVKRRVKENEAHAGRAGSKPAAYRRSSSTRSTS